MIEYLMIYQPNGLPIFSKCFGGFCKLNAKDDVLLSGFLHALETFPSMIGGEELKSVDLGNTTLVFRKTTPSGISIAIGLSEKAEMILAQVIHRGITRLVEHDFKGIDWNQTNIDEFQTFKKALYKDVLEKILHPYGGFKDQCPLGDQCILHTTALDAQKQSIWTRLKNVYRMVRNKMSM